MPTSVGVRQALVLSCQVGFCEITNVFRVPVAKSLSEERFMGAVIRGLAERFMTGEVPTKRALTEEKRYAMKNVIKEIRYEI